MLFLLIFAIAFLILQITVITTTILHEDTKFGSKSKFITRLYNFIYRLD